VEDGGATVGDDWEDSAEVFLGTVMNLEPSLLVYLAVPLPEGDAGVPCAATDGGWRGFAAISIES
jgi:hypothetical protein